MQVWSRGFVPAFWCATDLAITMKKEEKQLPHCVCHHIFNLEKSVWANVLTTVTTSDIIVRLSVFVLWETKH